MKTKKSFLSLLLIFSLVFCFVIPVHAADYNNPVLTVTPNVTTIDMGTGTADVVYTITLDPKGYSVAAFEFNLEAPDGMVLSKTKLKNAIANKGGNGYWVAANELKYDEDEETGIFETFTYTPATGYFGASGGIEGRTLDTVADIMTIAATVDISEAKTYTLSVTNFNAFGVGSVDQNAIAPFVTDVVIVGHEHTFETEWTSGETHHWHASNCGHENEVSDMAEHTYNQQVEAEAYKLADATCVQGVKYAKSCICGAASTSENEVFYGSELGGHEYGNLVPAQEEIHTQDELKAAVAAHYFCDVCDKYFTEAKEETTLVALTGEVPSHNFNGDWVSQGDAGHAHVCTCGKVDTVHEHESDAPATEESAEVCKHCGFEMNPMLDHVHVYNQENPDAEGALVSKATCTTAAVYKKSCKCGELSPNESDIFSYGAPDAAAHTYGELVAAQDAVHTQDELKGAVAAYYFCDACDKYFTEAKEETTMEALTSPAPVHEFNAWVNTDAENHWKKCVCGKADTEHAAAHVEQADDGDCSTPINCECGYEMVAAKSHDFTGEWKKDGNGHWHECLNDGCDKTETPVPHAVQEEDYNCMTEAVCVCGHVMEEAEAAHDFSGELMHDAEGHWYVCQNGTCTAADTKADHEAQPDDGDCETAVNCACGEEVVAAKSHDFTGEWHKNENGHWHECLNDGCTAAENEVPHSGDDDGNCLTEIVCECGEVVKAAESAHDFNTIWSFDEAGHYHVCQNGDCEIKDSTIPHSAEEDGDCTTPDNCVCGKEVTAAKADHDYSGEWKSDDNNHWKECQTAGCTVNQTAVPHQAQADDGDCTTPIYCECGKEVVAAKEAHDFTGEWKKDANGHWHECLVDGCEGKETVAEHEDGDDMICDICGYDSNTYIPRPPFTPPAPPVVDPDVPAEPETPAVDEEAELKAAVDEIELVARSSMGKAGGKKAIKLTWSDKNGSDLTVIDGFQIFRSTKRYSGFGKKPMFTTTRTQYWNTAIEDGVKYYYKVRGFVEINDEKYYTTWSAKAWRTVE